MPTWLFCFQTVQTGIGYLFARHIRIEGYIPYTAQTDNTVSISLLAMSKKRGADKKIEFYSTKDV